MLNDYSHVLPLNWTL